MRAKALLRRLRELFRRKKAAKRAGVQAIKRRRRPDGSSVSEPIILHRGPHSPQDDDADNNTAIITRAELQSSADSQAPSAFFAELPLEIRRMIYLEVWRGYLKPRRLSPANPGSDLRLHIYADGSARGTLGHTRCKVHPGAPAQEDTWVTAPWPFDNDSNPSRMPPRWFWVAWVMRLNWGKHWKCQHAIQKRWDPSTGSAEPVEEAPFLPLFLTCKKIYLEAIVSFFENVTPIFTSSVDAHRFFIQRPHSFLDSLRSLELSFSNPNDHLYLSKVWREDAVSEQPDEGSHADGNAPTTSRTDLPGSAAEPAEPETAPAHACIAVLCQINVFGQQLWADVLRGVQATSPNLRDLEVTIGGRISRHKILGGFGHCEDDAAAEPSRDEEGGGGDQPPGVWELPGKLAVTFKMDGQLYVQEGSKMVRRPTTEQDSLVV
ncbi:hypothetical protein VTK56DRAFT_5946 [Thermocarpiscus australiensis]